MSSQLLVVPLLPQEKFPLGVLIHLSSDRATHTTQQEDASTPGQTLPAEV